MDMIVMKMSNSEMLMCVTKQWIQYLEKLRVLMDENLPKAKQMVTVRINELWAAYAKIMEGE
jgi:hypothetical protein